jgi:predicted metal-dependent phosphoesterase TrpH
VEAGGLPVLAHPLNVLDQVPELVKAGLVGLEIYYPGYGEDNILGLLEFARQYGLLATGGTDFHGPTRTPGVELGGVWVPPEAVKQLQERLRRIALR